MQGIKRIAVFALILALLFTMGCARKAEPAPEADAPVNLYVSFYPLYAITDMLIEDTDVRLNCLAQPQDGCLRAYTLSDWDLALLTSSADAVIIGGRGLESFEGVLYTLGEDGPAVAAIFYDMELSEQKAVNTSEGVDSHWSGANPHIYMSIDGAMEIAQRIAATLVILDAEHEAIYKKNLENAQNRLKSLQEMIEKTLSGSRKRRVIMMNEALAYAAGEYGLKVELYYERESGEDIKGYDLESCLEALNASDSRIVLIEKQAPQSLVNALREAGFIVALMDTMSTRRAAEGADGYFEAHLENAQALAEAFEAAAGVQ